MIIVHEFDGMYVPFGKRNCDIHIHGILPKQGYKRSCNNGCPLREEPTGKCTLTGLWDRTILDV